MSDLGNFCNIMEYAEVVVVQEPEVVVVQQPEVQNPDQMNGGRNSGFNPVTFGLDKKFRLTKFADGKGRACKIDQNSLNDLLRVINDDGNDNELGTTIDHIDLSSMAPWTANKSAKQRIGIDASVVRLQGDGALSLVQTTDFIYPIVDDPYMMGIIACANVLSDLYAIGVTRCDNMLMLLGISVKMSKKERDIVVPLMMKGFKDCAAEAGTAITGGHTMWNPWCTIGGVATTVCNAHGDYIQPDAAVNGDVLVLTKPLGTQVAVCAYQWMQQASDDREAAEHWNRIRYLVSEVEVAKAYSRAMDSMTRLNLYAARLMCKYKAHGATDVTGYGLLGHAQTLAKCQSNAVSIVIHNLPVIAKMTSIAKSCGNMFQIASGTVPEYSGGLLICLPRDKAVAFCREIEETEGYQAWIIGIVEQGDRTARIINKPRIIEVPEKDRFEHLW